MGWLFRLRCTHWVKNTTVTQRKVSALHLNTPNISLHQGIVPDTLLWQFFNFFRTSPKYKKLIVHPGNMLQLREKFVTKYGLMSECERNRLEVAESGHFIQVEKLPLSELLEFIVFLSGESVVKQSNNYTALLRVVDDICCEKIPSLPVEEAVKMNYCWLSTVGTKIKFLKSFNFLLENYMNNIKESTLNTPVLVLIIFCSGIARKDSKAKEVVTIGLNAISHNKKQLHELSNSEIVVVAEVAFKTSSKFNNPLIIEKMIEIVSKDVSKFANDIQRFVVVIKAMRLNKNHNLNILKNIHKCLIEDKQIINKYEFVDISHLLALYADALYGDHEFLNYLIESALRSLSRKCIYNPYKEKGKGRAKDLTRLLWATSYLGYKIDEDILEKVLMPIIMEKVNSGVYHKQLNNLIETALSLWMMGYKPLNLLPFIFTSKMKKYLREINRVRYKARLQLLATCISIELPEAVDSVNLEEFRLEEVYYPSEETLLEQRPFLKRVFKDVINAVGTSKSIDITCENSLPYLNIPGIIMRTNVNHTSNTVNIEVLDNTNCLHETDTPNGLILLKLRLLRKLGHRVILVNYRDYDDQRPHIMLQIEDEIKDMQRS